MSEAQTNFYWALSDGDIPAALVLLESGELRLSAFDSSGPWSLEQGIDVSLACLVARLEDGDHEPRDLDLFFRGLVRHQVDIFAPTPPKTGAFVSFARMIGTNKPSYGSTSGFCESLLADAHLAITQLVVRHVDAAEELLCSMGLTSQRARGWRYHLRPTTHRYLDLLVHDLVAHERLTIAGSADGSVRVRRSVRSQVL